MGRTSRVRAAVIVRAGPMPATAAQAPPGSLRHAFRTCCPIRTGMIRTGTIRSHPIPWRAFARPIHDAPPASPAKPDQAAIPYATTAVAGVAPILIGGLPPEPEPAITPLDPA